MTRSQLHISLMLLLLTGIALSPHVSSAYEWEYLGMDGFPTTCITIDRHHDRMFVGTHEGFHYQDLLTEEWVDRDENGSIGRQVHAIQWIYNDDQRVITGRENAFFKGYLEVSEDLGGTSEVVLMSEGGRFVSMVAEGSTIFACSWSDITPGECLISADRGDTWTPSTGHGHTAMTCIDTGPYGLYVSGDAGVTMSQDLGTDWVNISATLPGAATARCVLADHPGGDAISPHVMVGTDQGLYVSYYEFGEVWEQLLATPVKKITSIWTPAPWPLGVVTRYVVITDDGRVLFSPDWGGQWVDETGDLPGTPVDVAFYPGDKGAYVCTANDGVYRVPHVISGVDDTPGVPAQVAITGWPNPFNPRVNLRLELPDDGPVNVKVYDARGRLVETLLDRWCRAGIEDLVWEPGDLASGVYLARVVDGSGASVARLVLVR